MIVGVPKEIKNNEFRVGMTPSGVNSFINNGHTVLIQKDAGLGSGYKDSDYSCIGAEICKVFDSITLSPIAGPCIFLVAETNPLVYDHLNPTVCPMMCMSSPFLISSLANDAIE